jgi:hypothetical protein
MSYRRFNRAIGLMNGPTLSDRRVRILMSSVNFLRRLPYRQNAPDRWGDGVG